MNPAVVVDFVANTKDLADGFKDAEKKAGGFGGKLKKLAGGGALAGLGALGATLKIGVAEFAEASKVGAQTEAVLKSTGGAAKVTAGHVGDLAESLMKKSGVDDEAIQSGENLLLTFTNIKNEAGKGNDVFDQTTKAALDMSVAMGTDMKSASMTLGKALNDPIKGMSKLSKQGVTFTDEQKKQAEAMAKAGDVAGAQKIILGEVNKEFGGSAEAAGKTLPGQLSILKESFSNFAGMLVAKVVPILQKAIEWLRDHWPEISKAFGKMWDAIKPILEQLGELLKSVFEVIKKAWPLIEPILESLWKQVQKMAEIIATAIKLVTDIIKGDWKAAWDDVKKIVSTAIDLVKERIEMAARIIGTVAKALGEAILNGIKAGVGAVAGWIKDRINDVIDAITNQVSNAYKRANKLGDAILDGIKAGAVGIYTWVKEKIQDALDAMQGFLDAGSIYNRALKIGVAILNGIKEGVVGIYSWVRDKMQDALDAMQGFLDAGSIYNRAEKIGSAILNGVKAGISGLVGAVKSTVQAALNAVIDLVNKFKIPPVKIKGKTIFGGWGGLNIPHVQLAQGGIVTRPTMALIGEAGPEAVVPLSKGGGQVPVNVRVFIGDTELRGLVRAEVVEHDTGIARTILAGVA